MDLLDRLIEHDQWATTQLLNISKKLTSEQQSQAIDVGHKSIGETLQHMIVNIEVWTSAMMGQEPTFDDNVPSLSEWYQRAYAKFSTFARQIRDEQRLEDTFTDQFDAPMTFGGAIVHVILQTRGTASKCCIFSNVSVCPTSPKSITGCGTLSGAVSSRNPDSGQSEAHQIGQDLSWPCDRPLRLRLTLRHLQTEGGLTSRKVRTYRPNRSLSPSSGSQW